VVAWNEATGEFRSGQVEGEPGFGQWLIKFDGVHGNGDKELADPQGFGKIEYAYYLMAIAAGISMNTCRLYEEGGRSHFMTKRFDRTDNGDKLHMQSLTALMHYDFNDPGAYSYEQAILALREIGASADVEQQVIRAFFNILGRNQDDHVKNIAFLMGKSGEWRLSPAFDVCYSYNPSGAWTSRHQMSLSGKRDGFDRDDLIEFGALADLKTTKVKNLISRIGVALGRWEEFCEEAGVPESECARIKKTFRALI
jgi:serine/threonine-protein kinase HipA